MDVEIKRLGHQNLEEFKDLIRVFEEVFAMEQFEIPANPYLQKLLEEDTFFVFVAFAGDKVVGGLTAYSLAQYYSTLPLVYIYDLAVKSELQRQGIGKRLMQSILDYCREMGVAEVFVQADEVDDYALDFYRATGGTAEKVVHFNYPLNPQ